ncbi:MAG: zinc ribbon domain-containing protein [Terracidiphilus sp.]|nr:zinc ribbon domain-containing protein [Terracidiphilus sp.]
MPNFCPHCAAALDPDARFCPACRAPVGVAGQLASEVTGNLKAGIRSVVSEAGRGVPPFIWAAALQVYWLLSGVFSMFVSALSVVVFAVSVGILSAVPSGLTSLFGGGGTQPDMERALLAAGIGVLVGALDTCLSTVLIYGFLTLKKWVHGVFMVWLPTRVILGIISYFLMPSYNKSGASLPFVVIFVGGMFIILTIAALVLEYILVKRGNAALDEA